MTKEKFILTVSCPDTSGIVAAITGCLAEQDCCIYSSDQFSDSHTQQFFMRTVFDTSDITAIDVALKTLQPRYHWDMNFHNANYRPRILIFASKQGHCLNDLLHKWHDHRLHADIVAVISNHEHLEEMTDWYRVPYYHVPLTRENKREKEILEIVKGYQPDLVVLAKYMQILSPELCAALGMNVINIHHSFLPSFKGSKPYHQAHERGVKLIGATAHFVTEDLDEGPIICQEVIHVDHRYSVEDYIRYGMDIESFVLSRSVEYFVEKRILLNGHKTVVFK